MRETPKTTCDQCSKDLSTTNYMRQYRAVITAEAMPNWGGSVYATALPPPVDRDHHFCNMVCLARWVTLKFPNAAEGYEKQARQRHYAETGETPTPSTMAPEE